jgi:hypothetical protein
MTKYGPATIVCCLVILFATVPGSSHATEAGPWSIVPGRSIGQVRLGMTRQALHGLLGSPQSRVRENGGIVVERWGTKKPSAKSAQIDFIADFITVYLQGNRVVQVDASSPAFILSNGLSTRNSAQEFKARYGSGAFHEINVQYPHDIPAGIPGSKHFVCIGDDIKQGFAWRYGWWGSLSPDGNPSVPLETLSVHLPDHPVHLDPDGAELFTITYDYVKKHDHVK